MRCNHWFVHCKKGRKLRKNSHSTTSVFLLHKKKKVDPKGESEVCGDNSASSVLVLQLLTQTIGGAHHPEEEEEEGGRESKHQQKWGQSELPEQQQQEVISPRAAVVRPVFLVAVHQRSLLSGLESVRNRSSILLH